MHLSRGHRLEFPTEFCLLVRQLVICYIAFANILDPDSENILKRIILKKSQETTLKMQNYPAACKEFGA